VKTKTTEHDFRGSLPWGRSWYVEQRPDGTMAGLTHCTPRIEEGDTARWTTTYGEAIGRFTKVTWSGNVDDLYAVELDVIERIEKP
jgi:hypothetical protein